MYGIVCLVLLPLARRQLRSSVLAMLGLRLRLRLRPRRASLASRVRKMINSRAGYAVIQL